MLLLRSDGDKQCDRRKGFFVIMVLKALFFILSNKRLVRGNGVELSHDELIKLWEFYNLFVESRYSKQIIRGESDENLRKQFFTDSKNPELLAECLFMTGEKGRVCWTDKAFLDPDNVSIENFESICGLLNRAISGGVSSKGGRGKRMRDFYERNMKFCTAIENLPQMLDVYKKLQDADRRKVNLYYLSVVHTINSHEYKKKSSYVSTTTDASIADRFTGDICIYGWVPRSQFRSIVGNRTIDTVEVKHVIDIRHTGIPYCDTPVYPEQEEVAIRCGLLPHFIIGFTINGDFYVNPAIFAAVDEMHEMNSFRDLCNYKRKIQLMGLEVNQENFEEFVANRTIFKKFFTFDGEKYEVHRVNKM